MGAKLRGSILSHVANAFLGWYDKRTFNLRGAWDKVRTDPVLKFMVVAITGYGMATFEGPALSLKNVNAIAHFTDWIIAHVHVGALAWNGFMAFGIIYYLIPRLFKTKL